MTKNVLKSKKAISPILATLLLIVIAVAAIVVTYAWIMTYMSSAGQQAGVILAKENVRFYGEPTDAAKNRTDVTVRNTGTENTKIVTIYMGKTKSNLVDVTAYSDLSTGKALDSKTAITIKVSWPISSIGTTWEAGETYYFRIISEGGQEVPAFPEQAPQ